MTPQRVRQDFSSVISSCSQRFRPFATTWTRFSRPLGLLALCLPALVGEASAQGMLDARYEATLAGIPVGKGAWVIEIADDQYSASASGGTSGLMRTIAGGNGTGASQGKVTNGQMVPATYTATTTSSKKSESIRMTLVSGTVKDFAIEPPPPVDQERIPLTDAHRRGVFDPMTGSFLRAPGTGDPISAETCRTATQIFDGRMRYDLKFDYKRIEKVKADKGYQGPALVCAIYFVPIAGYIPDRPAIKYLAEQRNMEVWLVPIAGTRVLVPFRLKIPTPLGNAVLEATQFITSSAPPKTASKTQ